MDLATAGTKAKKLSIRIAIGSVLLFVVGSVLCKTDEGDLAMVNMAGQPAQMFSFTVRDDQVAKQIEDLSGHRVVLEYEEHKGIPSSCFGDTTYFVTSVRKTD
jgi:hypothetical protein